ncbi:hypothetical protein [Pedobacter sp. P26]|uniref:hypothetical protein n=1 Tax=Pedobacter sp. P26 TaxID=3423956 RepID=UPI003D67D765
MILQSYTKDSINDIFKPFIERLFSLSAFSFNAILSEFMPKKLQEVFKEHSVIKEFTFTQKIIGKSVKDEVFHNNDYKVTISIRPQGTVQLSKLDKLKQKIGKFNLSFFDKNPQELTLENFNQKKRILSLMILIRVKPHLN